MTEERNNPNRHTLNLDDIVTTQPELGPSIPDGGWGWIVFVGTLFFQALIPCMILNFGIFLAFSKLENGTSQDKNLSLWDDNILCVPLLFMNARGIFDALARNLAAKNSAPRLIAVVGTCLTCAGLLFMWMGMTGVNHYWLFVFAGIFSGLGASVLMAQCEILLAQYFRLKLPILLQISQCVATLGFVIAPVILGHYILSTTITHVLLWYQAIILQGLVISLTFKKPPYLKSKIQKPYQFVLASPDDEEDIFSKNSRELQIKRQTSTESSIKRIEINEPQASSSTSSPPQKEWEKFEDDEHLEKSTKYAKLNNWEVFDEDDDAALKKENWVHFDDEPDSPRIINELSLAEETQQQIKNEKETQGTIRRIASPLFSDLPINNNNTYAYDDDIVRETPSANVFMPNTNNRENLKKTLEILKEPTFYKTLLMITANRYSSFVFYALFPSYLYIEVDSIKITAMTSLVGILSIINLIFLGVFYWINVDKKKRPVCFWVFYWIGSVGYFMISDYTSKQVLLAGAVQIVLSIGALDFLSKPLLGISVKGETSNEHSLLTNASSVALILLLFMHISFKTCFRLMAVLHFFTGALWLANYAYKKLRIT